MKHMIDASIPLFPLIGLFSTISQSGILEEQINTLKLGPQYAIERNPKQYINELIIDTENAIRHLQNNAQNAFRYIATKQIKQLNNLTDRTPCTKDTNTT
jgi:hypothetical protein